jgi:hypothetical protein
MRIYDKVLNLVGIYVTFGGFHADSCPRHRLGSLWRRFVSGASQCHAAEGAARPGLTGRLLNLKFTGLTQNLGQL